MKEREHGRGRTAAGILLQIAAWALLIASDQITKRAAAAALKGQPAIVLIDGVLELLYVQNTGAAFSMMQNALGLFILIAGLAVAAIGWLLHRLPKNRRFLPMRILLILISAGAAGNLIDRIQLGYVRDFIYISLIDFPVFNAADIYVTVSVAILAILIVFYYTDEDLSFLGRGAAQPAVREENGPSESNIAQEQEPESTQEPDRTGESGRGREGTDRTDDIDDR